MLSGELGVGKTAFARAFLRQAAGDPDLEAPSPTFTLVQAYEGRDCPLVHADFYRLREAEELRQIGFEETIQGAVTLVEWGERVAAALPAERLDVALDFDSAHGADHRLALFRPRGVTMTARFKAARAVEALMEQAGWSDARRAPMYGDASTRAYERLTDASGRTAILMIAPPRPPGPPLRFGKSYAEIAKLSPDIRAFLAVGEGLRGLGLFGAAGLRAQRRRRARAGRGFRVGDDRRRQWRQSLALRGGGCAARRPASARRCRANCCSRARPTPSRSTTSTPC